MHHIKLWLCSMIQRKVLASMRALIETFVTVRMNRVVLFWVLFCFVNDRRKRMGQVDLTEMYLAQGYLSSSATYHP